MNETLIDTILPKDYDYLNNDCYRIYNRLNKLCEKIESNSAIGIKIMNIYSNLVKLLGNQEYSLEIMVNVMSMTFMVLIQVKIGIHVKYFDEELKLKDEIPKIFAKNIEDLYKLDKHPYEYLL